MNLLTFADGRPTRVLGPNDVLVAQGAMGGDLYVLERGRLAVERDGIKLASIATPGALIGEMSVLLGIRTSATVRAEGQATVRVIADAESELANNPALASLVAKLLAARLDATSSVLVELTKQHKGKAELTLLSKVISALHLPADGNYVPLTRDDLFGGPEPARA